MPGMTGNRTLEDKYLNGLLAAVEVIRKGCTACYDLFFEFPMPTRDGIEALGRTYQDAGMRAVIAPMVGPQRSAAHVIWLDQEDLARLADNGSSVVHAPASNMRLGSGLAHVRPMLERGINVGIATDAANSSDQLNMFEALRLAALISRIQTADVQRWLGAEEVFHMATVGSAQAMGLDGKIGKIAPGYKADVVFLDLGHINYVPCHDMVGQIVFTENGGAVDSVMIAGRMVLDRGRLTTIDEAKLHRDAHDAAERLFAKNTPMRSFARELHGVVGQFCHNLACEPYHVRRWACAQDS